MPHGGAGRVDPDQDPVSYRALGLYQRSSYKGWDSSRGLHLSEIKAVSSAQTHKIQAKPYLPTEVS
jgi:hypothetical protein